MPLVTLQTRLEEVNREASFLRQTFRDAIASMAANPQSANAIVGLGQRLQASISNVLLPAVNHDGLEAYASVQFNNPMFALNTRLLGAKSLLEGIIGELLKLIPRTPEGYILKDIWNSDGSVTVRQIQANETVALRQAMQAFVDAIPE